MSHSKIKEKDKIMKYRIETDFLGNKQIPDDAFYGINAVRGHEIFWGC
jgi:aspartate ammonia-lyase